MCTECSTPEAVHVEHMIAGQLLVAPRRRHLLTADDADAIAARQILLSGVPEALVHVSGDSPVPQEVDHPIPEVAECPVQVPQLHAKPKISGKRIK